MFLYFLSFLIWNVTFLVGDVDSVGYEKPFNCGFDVRYSQVTNGASLRFFIIGILFLLFDVELILLFPISLGVSETDRFFLGSFFVFFVLVTLLMLFETGKDMFALL